MQTFGRLQTSTIHRVFHSWSEILLPLHCQICLCPWVSKLFWKLLGSSSSLIWWFSDYLCTHDHNSRLNQPETLLKLTLCEHLIVIIKCNSKLDRQASIIFWPWSWSWHREFHLTRIKFRDKSWSNKLFKKTLFITVSRFNYWNVFYTIVGHFTCFCVGSFLIQYASFVFFHI